MRQAIPLVNKEPGPSMIMAIDGRSLPNRGGLLVVTLRTPLRPLLLSHRYKNRHRESGHCKSATNVAFSRLESLTLCL